MINHLTDLTPTLLGIVGLAVMAKVIPTIMSMATKPYSRINVTNLRSHCNGISPDMAPETMRQIALDAHREVKTPVAATEYQLAPYINKGNISLNPISPNMLNLYQILTLAPRIFVVGIGRDGRPAMNFDASSHTLLSLQETASIAQVETAASAAQRRAHELGITDTELPKLQTQHAQLLLTNFAHNETQELAHASSELLQAINSTPSLSEPEKIIMMQAAADIRRHFAQSSTPSLQIEEIIEDESNPSHHASTQSNPPHAQLLLTNFAHNETQELGATASQIQEITEGESNPSHHASTQSNASPAPKSPTKHAEIPPSDSWGASLLRELRQVIVDLVRSLGKIANRIVAAFNQLVKILCTPNAQPKPGTT